MDFTIQKGGRAGNFTIINPGLIAGAKTIRLAGERAAKRVAHWRELRHRLASNVGGIRCPLSLNWKNWALAGASGTARVAPDAGTDAEQSLVDLPLAKCNC